MRYVIAAWLLTATACGPRQEHAYHFRSPLLGSVRAPDLPSSEKIQDAGTRGRRTGNRQSTQSVAIVRRRRTAPPDPAPVMVAVPRVRRSIPSEAIAATSGEELAGRLRGMVGRRDEGSTHVAAALAALGEVGAALDPELSRVEDGPALVALAERRGALNPAAPGAPLPALRLGDLLVFDGVVAADPASLVAVVVSVDERGVVELVYLSRGVIRRGFAFPLEPDARRDATGRVLNTFVRHNDGADPRGSHHLAGELIAGAISLDRLLR